MGEYLRFVALILVGLILSLVVSSREHSALLSLAVCVLVCTAAAAFLEPVTALIRQLQKLGELESEAVSILLKTALIGVLSELVGLLCADAGQGAMGKALQLLSNAAILWLSLPLFQQILTMLEGVLAQ